MKEETYNTLDRAYDNTLMRGGGFSVALSTSPQAMTEGTAVQQGGSSDGGLGSSDINSGGSVAEANVKSDGNFSDVWISNALRSTHWRPKTSGFYIDGQTGYAEFTNLVVTQSITGLTINGATINGGTISGATVILDNSVAGAGHLAWTNGSNIWEDLDGYLGFLANGTSTTKSGYYFYIGKGAGIATASLAFSVLRDVSGHISQAGFFSGIHCAANMNIDAGNDPANTHRRLPAEARMVGTFYWANYADDGTAITSEYIAGSGSDLTWKMTYGSMTGHYFDSVVQVGNTYTTTTRNALTATNGMIIYNTTTNKLEAYIAGAWHTISYT